MSKNVIKIILCFIFLAMNFSSVSVFSRGITEEEEDKRIAEHFTEPEGMRLPGNYLRAIIVAYNDFKQKIKRDEGDSSSLTAFASNIDNYFVAISKKEGDRNFRVWFHMKPFKGELLKDGGSVYIIDSKTFKIIEIKGQWEK